MPIIATDLRLRLAGGSANSDPDASLGGIITTVPTDINPTVSEENLFNNFTSVETTAGSTKFRGLYLYNAHGSISLTLGAVYIPTQTPSTTTAVAIALSAEGTGTMATIATEISVPATVIFSAPATFGAGLSTGTTASGTKHGLWIRVIVDASSPAYDNDDWSLAWQGTTTV